MDLTFTFFLSVEGGMSQGSPLGSRHWSGIRRILGEGAPAEENGGGGGIGQQMLPRISLV